MGNSKTFVSSSGVNPVPQLPGLDRRTLVWGSDMLLAEMTLANGMRIPLHNHIHEQVGYLVRGRLEFIVGDERSILEAGSGYLVPSNVPHQINVLEDSVVIDIFSPVRDEYLP